MVRRKFSTVLVPESSNDSALTTVTGLDASRPGRALREPVTTITALYGAAAASKGACAGGVSCANTGVDIIAKPSASGAAPALSAARLINLLFLITFQSLSWSGYRSVE